MYVCLCNRVTDKDIRRAATEGAASLSDLKSMLGVSSQCGSCAEVAQQVLFETYQVNPDLYYQVA